MSLLTDVSNNLLTKNKLDLDSIQYILDSMQTQQIDFADFYMQKNIDKSWILEEGIVKGASFGISSGVGVRAIKGEKIGFAYANEIEANSLKNAANTAKMIAKRGNSGSHSQLKFKDTKSLYIDVNPIDTATEIQIVELLEQVDKYARTLSPYVKQVSVSLSSSYEEILVVATDGTLAADKRPLVRFGCSVVLNHNGRTEDGSAGGGGRYGYQEFMKEVDGLPFCFKFAKEAVTTAEVNLQAKPAPAGEMTVVLGSGWPGILLHEAVGHGLEGDFIRKGSSVFSNKLGKKVASNLVTVIDDGTIVDRRGSLTIDDEGTPTQRNILIEDGILQGFMQDKLNARLMGVKPTGNGRRESYAHLPIPRMTNTFMKSGDSDPNDIIKSVKKGIYAPKFSGGQVDITSGKFVFSTSEAYLIENGEITTPIKGATLIGNGYDVMQQISMVGNDLTLDAGVGTCGKDGQGVPVGVGQPTIKVDKLTVGGTA